MDSLKDILGSVFAENLKQSQDGRDDLVEESKRLAEEIRKRLEESDDNE